MTKYHFWGVDDPAPLPTDKMLIEAMDVTWRLPFSDVEKDLRSGFARGWVEEQGIGE